MDLSFRDSVALIAIAGAGGGGLIAISCATKLSRMGAKLIIVGDSKESGDQLVSRVEAGGGDCVFFHASSFDAEEMMRIAEECQRSTGSLHVLINAQSVADSGGFEETSPESWLKAMKTNVLGPIATTRAFLPMLKAAGQSSVVHIGSVDGLFGNPSLATYSVSKGALIPLTHIMASELAKFGIRVNCVARAMVTGSLVDVSPMISVTPMGRAAEPEEIAEVVAFLASSKASYVNGAVLPVDGGRTGVTPGCFISAR